MALSERLQMNADMIPAGSRVADIGCDHGYVSIYLVRNKICDRVLAMDIREGPLSIAKKNIARAGFSHQITCRLSDGMEKLAPGEADTVLIAGMGGMLICRILEQSPDILSTVDTLVLQPQSDLAQVRRQVMALGYSIRDEKCCYDSGKWYLAIRAVRGPDQKEKVSEADYCYGWILPQRKDPVYYDHLLREKKKLEKIAAGLAAQKTPETEKRAGELAHRLRLLEDILSCFGDREQSPAKEDREVAY